MSYLTHHVHHLFHIIIILLLILITLMVYTYVEKYHVVLISQYESMLSAKKDIHYIKASLEEFDTECIQD